MTLKFNSILIVTYGRSGSTLLQGLLNSIDGVLIRGENENFIFGLYEAYTRLNKAKEYGLKESAFPSTHSWYGSPLIDTDLFIDYSQRMIRDIILADFKDDENIRAYGFKEIRYFLVDNFHDYLDFLSKIFPNVCFIFNTRNINDVVKSAWWSHQDRESVENILVTMEKKFKKYAEKNINNCFSITYEDLVRKTDKLKSMFEFVGADYLDTEVDKILFKKHSTITKVVVDSCKRVIYSSDYSKFIKSVVIDNLPEKIIAGDEFSFEGVVIPKSNDLSIASIKVVTSSSIFNGVLGLGSPVYGQKYPDIKGSSKSRFKVDNIVVKQQEIIKVIVEIINKDQRKNMIIATVEVKPEVKPK